MVGLAPTATAEDAQSQQWYLKAMQAEKMWKVSTGEGIKVAVVDSGVDSSTQSLQGQVLPGKDFSGAPGDETRDDLGHGTTVAELIAGSGKGGTLKGLAPGAKIIPVRTNLDQMKNADQTKDHVGEAIRAAADSDAQIINMSFAGVPDPAMKKAISYAVKKGKLLLAGTGNDAQKGNNINFPAGYWDVVAVGATDKSGKIADFSSRRQTIVAGPGVDIPGWCDGKKQRYCSQQGTSMATAIASASAALIWSKHPDWTANQVSRVLIKTAGLKDPDKGPGKGVGFGAVRPRINLLENKGDPGDPDISPLTGARTLHTKSKSSSSHAKDAGKDSNKEAAPGQAKVADSKSKEKDGGWLLPALGIAAGVVVLAGCGFAAVRLRRN
ncbi:S8 family serine peptidase [Streptomyces sp. 8N114]|uniref:S8 family serine peptidase n=1 Tax=Streptomyces sp. 8N114 TaxID=3457419 RepID=UPI003FD65681